MPMSEDDLTQEGYTWVECRDCVLFGGACPGIAGEGGCYIIDQGPALRAYFGNRVLVLHPGLTEYHILVTHHPLAAGRDEWESVREKWIGNKPVEVRKVKVELAIECEVDDKRYRWGRAGDIYYVSEITKPDFTGPFDNEVCNDDDL